MICCALGMRGSHFHATRALFFDRLPSMLHALKKHMRRLRLMTTEKCSYRSSVSVSPSISKSRMSSASRVTVGRSTVDFLAEEVGVVAAAIAIVGGDRLRLVDELRRLVAGSAARIRDRTAARAAADRCRARCSRSVESSGWRCRRRCAVPTLTPEPSPAATLAARAGAVWVRRARAAGADVVEQLLHDVGAHRVVRREEAAAEMQAERLAAVEIEHDGAGIAAERRAIVPECASARRASRRPARAASCCRSCRRSAPSGPARGCGCRRPDSRSSRRRSGRSGADRAREIDRLGEPRVAGDHLDLEERRRRVPAPPRCAAA